MVTLKTCIARAGLCAALWGLVAFVPAPAVAQAAVLPTGITAGPTLEGVSEYRLPNGMKVVLYPFNDKPDVTLTVVYGVGARDDVPGFTGYAHLLEHMLFKGTPSTPDVAAAFRERGMRWNATTTFDRTAYFATFAPKDPADLDWLIGLEAERMTQATFGQKELDSEMTVVRNEFEIGMSNPRSSLLDALRGTLFHFHPYGRSVIGERNDIERASMTRLRQMYTQFYRPDNATLLIAGRMDVPRVLARVSATFGRIPKPSQPLVRAEFHEPAQLGEREVTVGRVGGTEVLMLGYRTPAARHPDQFALAALSYMLNSNPQGVLFKQFVEPKRVALAGSGADAFHQQGVFVVLAQPNKGQSMSALRDELTGVLESKLDERLEQSLFDQFKKIVAADQQRVFENPGLVAQLLVESAAQGDWRLWFAGRERLDALTLDDVKRVARTYLTRWNRTTAMYVPQESPRGVAIPSPPSIESLVATIKPRSTLAEGELLEPDPKLLESRTTRLQVRPGLQVATLNKRTRNDNVSLAVVMRFGSPGEGAKDLYGNRVWQLITQSGTPKRDRTALVRELTELRADLNIVPLANAVRIEFNGPKASVEPAMTIAADLLRNPILSPEAFDRIRQSALSTFDEGLNDPGTRIDMIYAQVLNQARKAKPLEPDYRYVPRERRQQLEAMTLDSLRASYARWGASDVYVVAVGPVDAAALGKAVNDAFVGWRQAAPFSEREPAHTPIPGQRHHARVKDRPNGLVDATLYLPMNERDAQAWPMQLAAAILGGGAVDSRLGKRLRDSLGASYTVRSGFNAPEKGNRAFLDLQATFPPARADEVLAAIAQEIERVRKDGFTQAELDRFRTELLAALRERRQQDWVLMGGLTQQLTRPGWSWARWAEDDAAIRAVTLDQLNAAMRQYVRWQDFVVVTSGEWGEDSGLGVLPK